jgi:phosphoglycerate kinase
MNPLLNKKTLNDVELKNKKVLVRLDLNVPIKNGKVVDPKRIVAALPTLQMLINNNCKIIILSHLGRIKTLDDKLSNKKSLAPVAKELQLLLPNNKISFLNENTGDSVINAVNELNHGEIIVLENTRYNDVNENNEIVNGESKNNPSLGKF